MRRLLKSLVVLTLLTMVEVKLLRYLGSASVRTSAWTAASVLSGHASLRTWQSRVLGPLIVEALARITGRPFVDVFQVVTEDLVVIANLTCFLLARRLTRSDEGAVRAVFLLAVCFVAMNDGGPVWIWDFVDLSTGLLFGYAIVTGSGPAALTALFAVELLNRESAEFIALWALLSALEVKVAGQPPRVRWGRAAWGLLLLLAGAVWTSVLRARMADPPSPLRLQVPLLMSQQFRLPNNLRRLRDFDGYVAFSVGMFWAFWSLLVRIRDSLTSPRPVLVAFGAAMSCAILVFGVATEPRLYVWLAGIGTMFYAKVGAPELQSGER